VEEREEVFDPKRYWEQRSLAHPDITRVGYLGLSPKFVEYQYRSRMHQVELKLRYYGLAVLAVRSVLAFGSGIGIWLNFWHQHGASCVAGLGFTALAACWKTTKLWGGSNILAHLVGPIVTKVDQLACRLCSDGNSWIQNHYCSLA